MHKPTVTTDAFVTSLQPHAGKRLIFEYDGKRIQPGYHVTEIKAASFRSLDCGANPQQWHETIVQLWDVADKPEEGHMTVRKFLAIWDKVNRDVGLDGDAEIKFEWGDTVTPAVSYTFNAIREEGDAVVSSLEPVRATCKPRDEWWLQTQPTEASACCGAHATASDLDATISVSAIQAGGACCASLATEKRQSTVHARTCC